MVSYTHAKRLVWLVGALALLLCCNSCEDVNVSTAPNVISTVPTDRAKNIPITTTIGAQFSRIMDPSTITSATFSIDNGVTGTVNYTSITATFIPSRSLTYNTMYVATITRGVKDRDGNALDANYSWSFTTKPPPPLITGFSPDSGRGGTVVTITGLNFMSNPVANVVRFNGVSATIVEATSRQIQAIVPDVSTTGLITVATPGGKATSDKHFVVIQPGSIWTPRTPPVTSSLADVVWAGSQFVAVGASGTILTSPDGITWTTRTSGTTSRLNGLTWSGQQIVAVGAGGTILASQDGVDWEVRSSDTTESLFSVAWSGSHFVAVGAEGLVLSSSDDIGWHREISRTDNWLYGVTWFDSLWVIVGYQGTILTSFDGSWWTSHLSETIQHLLAITPMDNQLVAVGYSGSVLVSSDGITWTSQQSGTERHLGGITWSGSLLVAVGAGGTILTSPDGVDWTKETSGTSSDLNDVAWSGVRFVAVGENGTILTSE